MDISGTGSIAAGDGDFDHTDGEFKIDHVDVGDYGLSYRSEGNCPDTANKVFTVVLEPIINLSYPDPILPDSFHFCEDYTSVLQAFTNPRDAFPVAGTFGTVGATGLVFSTTTPDSGYIDVDASAKSDTGTTHFVTFEVTAGICTNIDTVKVVLYERDTADFGYGVTPGVHVDLTCQTTDTLNIWEVYPPSTGTFSSVPAMPVAALDDSTGAIAMGALPADTITYTVTHESIGFCKDTHVVDIRIIMQDTLTWTYPNSPEPALTITSNDTAYCDDEDTLKPLIDPLLVYPTGTFSDLSGVGIGIDIDPITGEIDLSNSESSYAGVDHLITFTTTGFSIPGMCQVTETLPITLFERGDATFDFIDLEFCKPVDTNSVLTFGPDSVMPDSSSDYWYAEPVSPILPDSFNIDSTTGEFLIADCDTQSYYLYRIQPSIVAICPDTVRDSIHLIQTPDAGFRYDDSVYCVAGAGDTARILGDSINGFFHVDDPVGIVVDSVFGALNAPASSVGFYEVYYTVNRSFCINQDTFSIEMREKDNTFFSYDGPFCEGAGNPIPDSIASTGGTFYFVSGPDSLIVNSTNGELDLASVSPIEGDTFLVRYQTAAQCPASDTIEIEIYQQDSIAYSYDTVLFCNTASTPLPNLDTVFSSVPGGVGTFSDPTSTVDINPLTGALNLGGTPEGGPYILTYISTGFCPDTNTFSVAIEEVPIVDMSYSLAGDTGVFCPTDNNPAPFFTTGVGGGAFGSGAIPPDPDLVIEAETGIINLSSTGPGKIYAIQYITPSLNCPDTVLTHVSVWQQDVLPSDLFTREDFCPSADSIIDLVQLGGAANFDWQWNPILNPTDNLTIVTPPGSSAYIDLLASDPGLFELIYISLGDSTSALCPDTASDIIQVILTEPSDFHYLKDTVCAGENPLVAVLEPGTVPGGMFTGWAIDTTASPIVIDSITGEINLELTAFGNGNQKDYVVEYTTPGACRASSTDTVTIFPRANAEFEYPKNIVCLTDFDTLLLPNILFDSTGGFSVFSDDTTLYPDTGLTLSNALTGELDFTTSIAGKYWVRYVVGGLTAECNDSTEVPMELVDPPLVNIYYGDSMFVDSAVQPLPVFCHNLDTLPLPVISGIDGGFFRSTSDPIFEVNSANGALLLPTLDTADVPAVYTIEYEINDGSCVVVTSTDVSIISADNADFAYDQSIWCQRDTVIFPSSIGSAGGVFTGTPGLAIVDTSGAINLLASDAIGLALSYTVSYTTDVVCSNSNTFNLTINPTPMPGITVDPSNQICMGDEVLFTAIPEYADDGATDFLVVSGIDTSVIPTAEADRTLLMDDLLDGDQIIVREIFQGCAGDTTVTMLVRDIPDMQIAIEDYELVGTDSVYNIPDNQFTLLFTTIVDSTKFIYTIDSNGTFIPEAYFDSTTSLFFTPTDSVKEQTLLFVVENPLVPGRIKLLAYPKGIGGCDGPLDSIYVNLLPTEDPLFVPGIFTPNGDGFNDFWTISFPSTINPMDYKIRLFNRSGGLVRRFPSLDFQWDGSGSVDGTYWYIIYDRSGAVVKKSGLEIRRDFLGGSN